MLILEIEINLGCGMPPLYLVIPIHHTVGKSKNFSKRELVLPISIKVKCQDLLQLSRDLPIFIIHSDSDKVVPLVENSGAVQDKYQKLGGKVELEIAPGKDIIS